MADIKPASLDRFVKSVSQRWLGQPCLETFARKSIFREFTDDPLVFQSGRELDFPKLHRLKSTRRVELIAKSEKVDRRHAFQDVNLVQQQLFDLHHSLDSAR